MTPPLAAAPPGAARPNARPTAHVARAEPGRAEPARAPDPATPVATLPNGVRVVTVNLPHLQSAGVSVFVRSGSRHEQRRLNGISHVVEHMAFKGTRQRTCQQINLDAERLGADVNAHTDKDHTAYHLRGHGRDATTFVRMLGDIVLDSTFPAEELDRERQVILQEYAEDEDDPMSIAFRQFDRACYGLHPVAQPVIGQRAAIERLTRDDLMGYVHAQYTGCNVIVAAAGAVDHASLVREAEAAFGGMPAGVPNEVTAPAWVGGLRTRPMAGSNQTHFVLGFPMPSQREQPAAAIVAAAVFGEGMSSPLMDRLREQLGLVYYAACSADVYDLYGQFVIEASTTPEKLDACLDEIAVLLRRHAEAVDPVAFDRAQAQLTVRRLRAQERPLRRLEDAALDLFTFDRVRPPSELDDAMAAVSCDDVRLAFRQLLAVPPAVAVAGRVRRGTLDRLARFSRACAAG